MKRYVCVALVILLFCTVLPIAAAAETTFSFWTSHMAHYTEDTVGSATVTMSDAAQSALYTADFIVKNGDTEIFASRNTAFLGGVASFSYMPQSLEMKVKYAFTITVHTAQNSVAAEYTASLMRFDRPQRIDKDGNYILNGEIFHPVFGYHVDFEDYPRMAELGINVVTVGMGSCNMKNAGRVQNALDMLEQYDLYGIFGIYLDMNFAGSDANIENTRRITRALCEHPRVFAWAVMDEPCGSVLTDEDRDLLEKSYFEVRKNDDLHPVYICDYNPAYYADDVKYCDVFAPDIYSRSISNIRENTALAVSAAKTRPVYPVVRSYGENEPTLPKGYEIKHFAYQALMGGGRGVGFYSISDCIHTETEKIPLYATDRWPYMQELCTEYPTLMAYLTTDKYADEETDIYLLRTYENGCHVLLFKSSGDFMMDTGGKALQVLAGDKDLLTVDGNTLRASGNVWKIVLFRFAEAPLCFLQGGIAVETIQEGELSVCSGTKGARLFVSLQDGAGKIIALKMSHGADRYPLCTITVPADGKTYTVKAFLWRGDTWLAPLTMQRKGTT